MSKTEKEKSLMDKVEEIIKPLKEALENDEQPKQKRTAPPAVSSGDIELDNAFKKALRAGKFKK